MAVLASWVVASLVGVASAGGLNPPLQASLVTDVAVNATCDGANATCIGDQCFGCVGHSNVSALIDGNVSSFWASPAGQQPVAIELDLRGRKEVQNVVLTFGPVFPTAVVIERINAPTGSSSDGSWQPWQFFAVDCVAEFDLANNGAPSDPQDPVCTRIFQRTGNVMRSLRFDTLNPVRLPQGFDYRTDTELHAFSLASRIRVVLVRYAESSQSYDYFGTPIRVDNFPLFVVQEIAVAGRCECNGHAASCAANGTCACDHGTVGLECERCAPTHRAEPWAAGLIPLPTVGDTGDANACVSCNCSGRASRCDFNASRVADVGDGSDCSAYCADNTTGFNCERCAPGFYRVAADPGGGTRPSPSPAWTCAPCECDADGSESAVCDPEDGTCACKQHVVGALCNHCARGYRSLSAADPLGCTACECFQPGTRGLAVDCDEFTGCDCLTGYTGERCAQCDAGFFQPGPPSGGAAYVCTACPAECDDGGCTSFSTVVGVGCRACRNDRLVNGSVVSCVASCAAFERSDPAGYFLDPADASRCGVCDDTCYGGCTDVGPRSCFRCRSALYRDTCVDGCPPLTWAGAGASGDPECFDCHEQCSGGCTGPTAAECTACANAVAANGSCVASCDFGGEYVEPGSAQCRACDPLCSQGCTGAGPASCLQCGAGAYLSWPAAGSTSPPSCTANCDLTTSFVVVNGSNGAPRECRPCAADCTGGCSGPSPSECASCAAWRQNGSCVLACGAGFFEHVPTRACVSACPDGTHVNGTRCDACPPGCTSCSSGTDCGSCDGGLVVALSAPLVCVGACAAAEYVEASNTTLPSGAVVPASRCRACDAECASCDGPGLAGCTRCRLWTFGNGTCGSVCSSDHYEDRTTLTCYARCPAGTHPSGRGCAPCPDNCTSCLSAQQCEACADGYVLSAAGAARLCVPACAQDEYATLSNVTLSSGGTALVSQCRACDGVCAACDGPGPQACTSCLVARLHATGSCVAECPDLHFVNGDGVCEPCSPQCESGCTGPLPTQCVAGSGSGDDGCALLQEDGECVPSCSEGWFVVPRSTTCARCHPTCLGCDGRAAQNCTRCANTRFLSAGRQCLQCHAECGGSGRCSGSTSADCLEGCRHLTALGSGAGAPPRCVAACSANWATVNGSVCVQCDPACAGGCTGSRPSDCASCAYATHLGECVTACPPGWTRSASGACAPCDAQCVGGCTGLSALDCTACAANVYNGACVASCPSGTVAVGGDPVCRPCHPTCVGGCTGTTASDCARCRVARFQAACVSSCPATTALNTATGECVGCHAQCSSEGCFGPSPFQCRSCANLLHGAMCTDSCPEGFYADFAAGLCRRCDPECVDCSGPGPLACGRCANYADATSASQVQCVSECSASLFASNGTCVEACPPSAPFFSDVRVTGEAAPRCAASCAALGDPRLETTFAGTPQMCSSASLVEADSAAARDDSSADATPMWIGVGVAAAVVLVALVAAIVVTTRKGSKDDDDNEHGEGGTVPPNSTHSTPEFMRLPDGGPAARSASPYINNPVFRPHSLSPPSSPSPRALTTRPVYLDVASTPTSLDDSGTCSSSL